MSDKDNNLWGSVKEGALKACDGICGYKKNRKCNVNIYGWNSGVKNDIQKKKEEYKEMEKKSH